mmetsp:Transcript_43678/g.117832  ORF Transcript_43678/g.117832 Transcript_43678/m.117832 type:complete len:185 (-) Transcript_43678:26-580(-)
MVQLSDLGTAKRRPERGHLAGEQAEALLPARSRLAVRRLVGVSAGVALPELNAVEYAAAPRAPEAALRAAGVRSSGLATGDCRLREDHEYCSYRNEAFVAVPPAVLRRLAAEERAFYAGFRSLDGRVYPPNCLGYNAKWQEDPFRANWRPWPGRPVLAAGAVLVLLAACAAPLVLDRSAGLAVP